VPGLINSWSACSRPIVFEKFQDYWNKDNVHIDRVIYLPIVDSTVRLANLKSGALDLIERVLATDIKNVRADQKSATRHGAGAWLPGARHQCR
jgi:ABC-type oligopeptide transport system substrate-binding subunit